LALYSTYKPVKPQLLASSQIAAQVPAE